jgi:hypothetical protein
VTLRTDPIAVALRVVDALESLGIVCTVGGSIAASFAGEPRSTIDIDIVVQLELDRVPDVVAALGDDFYLDEHALERAIRQRSSTNLIHHATQLKVDLFVAGGTPLDAQQLARRLTVSVGGGVLPIHPPEDILLQKLRWFRAGGEVSDRRWRDVLAIVRVQGTHLDTDYLRANASALGVEDLLARVLA